MLAELKQTFLEAYDENSDGKIDIREVSLSQVENESVQAQLPRSPSARDRLILLANSYQLGAFQSKREG